MMIPQRRTRPTVGDHPGSGPFLGRLGLTGIVCLGAALGCIDERAWTRSDSWYRPISPDEAAMADDRWQDVEPARIHEVRASNLAAAAKLLDTASWIELNPETARDLTGQPLPDSPPTKFYLVRAVYLNRGTGKFYIRTTNGYLWVAHGCLGARPVPMKRQPLVVQLEHPPKDVYVSCSMAQ